MKTILIFIMLASFSLIAKEPLQGRQWGLNNVGQEFFRSNGRLTREEIQSKNGMDINWVDLNQIPNSKKKREVIVAIIDHGIDIEHPELKDRIWFDKEACPTPEDEKKRPCRGHNFLAKNNDLSDEDGHGTHIAGIIAADDNGIGIKGVTPKNIKIMPLKVLNKDVRGFVHNKRVMTDIFADAIKFALIKKADVINMSLGWPKLIQTPKITKAFAAARKQGVAVVVAAGNNNKEIVTYPCSLEGVICVGSFSPDGDISPFSNFGGKVDVLAPGDFIFSTYPTKGIVARHTKMFAYERIKGTSQAAPFVTGVLASLKWLYPDISLGEMEARLFHSASKVDPKTKKFTKYGRINMKKAIGEKPKRFVVPDFKSLQEVLIDAHNGFRFNLKFKNYLPQAEVINAKVSIWVNNKTLQEQDIRLTFQKEGTQIIPITGAIKNLNAEARARLQVIIEGDERVYQITLFLGHRPLLKNPIDIKGIAAKDLLAFTPKRRFLKWKRIDTEAHREFFYVNKKTPQMVDILRLKGGQSQYDRLETPALGQLLAIFKKDINLDGKDDYFLYYLDREKKQLTFYFLNEELKPLWQRYSTWNWPLSSFEGLPLKASYQADFNWLKYNDSKLGEILVPSIFKAWKLPEVDNNDDLFDRLPETGSFHLYFLRPQHSDNGIRVEVRVVDNYQVRQKLQRELLQFSREELSFNLLPQSKVEKRSGTMRLLVSYGEEFLKSYALLQIGGYNDVRLVLRFASAAFLARNNHFPLMDLSLANTQSYVLTALLNRSEMRMVSMNGGQEKERFVYKTKRYDNPLFNFLWGFDLPFGNEYWLETRYEIHVVDAMGSEYRYPINRESAFPGVAFGETMDPVIIGGTNGVKTGVFIDSRLIAGERLFAIYSSDNGLKAPISLSFQLPDQCVDGGLQMDSTQGMSSWLLFCRTKTGNVQAFEVPLDMRQ